MGILISGAMTMLGREVLHQLGQGDSSPIYVLVPHERIVAAKRAFEVQPRVRLVSGDPETPEIVFDETARKDVFRHVEKVFHFGGSGTGSPTRAYFSQVVATQNLLNFASRMKKLKQFHYCSSLEVSGNYSGIFRENMLDMGQTFTSPQGNSRFRAETLVWNWKNKRVEKIIYRPGILVPESSSYRGDGEEYKGSFEEPVSVMKSLIEKKWFKNWVSRLGYFPLPFNRHTSLYYIPLTFVASSIALISQKQSSEQTPSLKVYHLIGEPGGVNVELFLAEALKSFGLKVKPLPVPLYVFQKTVLSRLGLSEHSLLPLCSPCDFDSFALARDFPKVRVPSFKDFSRLVFTQAHA